MTAQKISATRHDSTPDRTPSPTPPTKQTSNTKRNASGGNHKATTSDAQPMDGPSPVPDHRRAETQELSVGDEFKATKFASKTSDLTSPAPDHLRIDAQNKYVGGEPLEPSTTTSLSKPDGATSGWLELRIWAEMLYDAQKARIAASNRGERGGVDPDIYRAHVEQLEAVEHGCALAMKRCYRRVVPAEVVAWQKNERGIGEHLMARLIGHLGDPYVATPHAWLETPPAGHVCDPLRCGEARHLVAYEPYVRKVSQLWSYCGVGDPLRKRRAGMTQQEAFGLGSPICKTLIHLLAEACMKQPNGNKYRDIYTAGREKYVTREDWKPGRQHNAALRLVKKELLRDLWLARHSAVSQVSCETHCGFADGTPLATSQLMSEIQDITAGGEPLEQAS